LKRDLETLMFRNADGYGPSRGELGVGPHANTAGAGERGMMRRVPRGATNRPAIARPGAGHGRSLRVGPPPSWRAADVIAEARAADPLRLLLAPDALAVAELTEVDLAPSSSPAP
jgi:hypothetical protein